MLIRFVCLTLVLSHASCRLGYDVSQAVSDDAGPELDGGVPNDASQIAFDAGDAAASGTTVTSGDTNPGAATEDVPLPPVVLSESFVTCSRRSSSSQPNLNNARCQLIDGSTLRIASAAHDPLASVAWSVVHVPGAIVKRGTASFDSLELKRDVAIGVVDETRAFVLLTSSSPAEGPDDDEKTQFTGSILAGELRLERGATGSTATVDWQVVELPNSSVQSGTTIMPGAAISLDVPLGAAVDPSRSFVTFSTSLGNDIDGEEASYKSLVGLSDVLMRFTRATAGEPLTYAWFVVQLPLGSLVTRTEGVTTAPHDELSIDLAVPTLSRNSFVLTNVEIASGISRTALSASSVSATVGEGGIRLERNSANGSSLRYQTQAVEIAPPAP